MKEKSEDQIIRTEYSEVMQKSYIDYAMSVIISRAHTCHTEYGAVPALNRPARPEALGK
jgi:hypothetical protein